jgi:chromosomal replication initiation ATPase DnaA
VTAQLVFDLAAPPALGREDFFVSGANRLAADMLARPDSWPQGKLILTGPEGSGKSHLARIWAADRAAATIRATSRAGTAAAPHTGRIPDAGRIPDGAHALVEDADRVAGDAAAETALFHLHNRVLATGGRLLLTARTPPRDWGIRLPDLASRMEATARAALNPPDDALLAAVMVKLFADRQIAIAPNVVAYLVPRIDRSFAALHALVARLDRLSLASGRAITRALAAGMLASLPADLLDSPAAAGPSSARTEGANDAG